MENIKQYKVHCSGIHSIIAAAKSPRTISVGAETAVKNWYLGQIYGKNPLHSGNKYTEKGLKSEDSAVAELMKLDIEWYEKNTETFENEFILGTPDIITDSKVIDIKCSWDCFSFPYFETELDPVYWWQVQGYMELTGLKSAEVVYMLMDAPYSIIVSESYKVARSRGVECDNDIIMEITERMQYSHLEKDMRVKRFIVEHDPTAIQRIYDRVTACRDYLKTIII